MTYLELAKSGKNNWWRYLLGFLLLLFMSQVVAAIPFIVLAGMLGADQDPATGINPETMQLEGIDPIISLAVMFVGFIPALLGVFLAVRFIHKRAFLTLITAANRINWKRFLQGALVFLGITGVMVVADILLFPEDYKFTFDASRFELLLLVALLLTPIQAITEELLFRGYLMQGLGLVANKWVAVVVSSLLFALPHLLNPETANNPLMALVSFFAVGMLFALITIRDNGLELAMGVHVANNLAAFLLVTQPFMGLELPAIFTNTGEVFSVKALLMYLVAAAVFYWVMFRVLPRQQQEA